MSKSEVERFVAELQGNAALRAAIKKTTGVPQIVEIATRHGYRCTLDETRAFIKAKVRTSGNDLSDEALDNVAGGVTPEQHRILVGFLAGLGP
ncbi:hypothetical protein BH11PSE3_BH11PSE3_07910 [soil metagenome]